jgi:hypothetical protein
MTRCWAARLLAGTVPTWISLSRNVGTLKVFCSFCLQDGKVLGCQAVGEEGVEKRVDVVAAFMQKAGTVFDLEEAELCYGERLQHLCNKIAAQLYFKLSIRQEVEHHRKEVLC